MFKTFQSTLPTRGETDPAECPAPHRWHFNPLSPHGERRTGFCILDFSIAISIHSPRTGRDHGEQDQRQLGGPISIHSPRTGRDEQYKAKKKKATYFNPLSPHGERRFGNISTYAQYLFQSTLPARGETPNTRNGARPILISIHSPRTGRDLYTFWSGFSSGGISIHSPRTGRDMAAISPFAAAPDFNPLSPHGERHLPLVNIPDLPQISIHSPRTGRDVAFEVEVGHGRLFQSTLPARGETLIPDIGDDDGAISIHSPRTGRDREAPAMMRRLQNISIHSPRTGRDRRLRYRHPVGDISIHSPRTGRDTM